MIDRLLEKNLLPDCLVRMGIRRLLARRLADEAALGGDTPPQARLEAFAADLRGLPIAINTDASKEQHYEVPTAFYERVLGPRLKYSCCWFERGDESLAEAEEAMLRIYAERAGLANGQDVLELGCGWGSLSLWVAGQFPDSRVVGVSHSRTQKEHIAAQARARGLRNLSIITCDMNEFDAPAGRFDRVVSVEMFEHMKNWPRLLASVARWLRPGGRLFLHVFSHRELAYHFVARDSTDWMSRYFFTGGMMPADGLLPLLQEDMILRGHWRVNGRHYQRTAELWLRNMDANRRDILPILASTYGDADAEKWWAYWRTFLMSCAELWGYRGGEEWIVSHYLMEKPAGNAG